MNPRLIAGALALALCVSSAAEASTINFNPSTDVFLDHPGLACTGDTAANTASGNGCYSFAFTYALLGFDPALHQLLGATLTLTFSDDSDDRAESVNIVLDDVLAHVIALTTSPFTTSAFDVVSQLEGDGLLGVLLQVGGANQGNNDFYFETASLVATWQQRPQDTLPTTPVPEPVELALFGTALITFAFKLRRWKS